jgi:hypothetical protein
MRAFVLFILLAGFALSPLSGEQSEVAAERCRNLPFFDLFRRTGQLDETADGWDLRLHASQHAADCGGLDSYGTEIHLRFCWLPGPGCAIGEGIVLTRDYGSEFGENRTLVERFAADGGRIDLSDPETREAVLRNPAGDRAIRLLAGREGFYYYEEVEAGDELLDGLDPGDEESLPGGRWGATQNYMVFESLETGEHAAPRIPADFLGPEPWSIRVARFEGDRRDPACRAFFLTQDELLTYFRNARPSRGHAPYPEPKCAAFGKVSSSRGSYEFKVTDVGTGSFYGTAEQPGESFVCGQQCYGIFEPGGSLLDIWQRGEMMKKMGWPATRRQ